MFALTPYEPIDYLIIGHITCDLTPQGLRIGGTAAYASLTAQSLGMRVGIVTSWGSEINLGILNSIPIVNYPAEQSTIFENINTPKGRIQYIHNVAHTLDFHLVPEPWRNSPIVHLGPVAQEVEPAIVTKFPNAFIGLTPQGWLRSWNSDGKVSLTEWPEGAYVLQQAKAAVISIEDINYSEARIEEMAASCHVLVVTEASEGARLYWNGDVRRFRPPQLTEVDSTGSGDIFAAAFFIRLFQTRDPWEATRFATQLATLSITRPGISAIPTIEEIQECLVEVL